MATSCPYEEKRRRGRGIKGGGELFCFGFASPCACTLFESCRAERHSSPHPLYNKVKNNLKWLFFTQESQTRNPKFNQTKFSTLKIQVWASKFKIRSKNLLKTTLFRRRNRRRYVIISRILKSRWV